MHRCALKFNKSNKSLKKKYNTIALPSIINFIFRNNHNNITIRTQRRDKCEFSRNSSK